MVSWGPYTLCLPLLCMILTAVELPDYDDKEEVIQLLQRIPQELQLTQIRHHHLQGGGGRHPASWFAPEPPPAGRKSGRASRMDREPGNGGLGGALPIPTPPLALAPQHKCPHSAPHLKECEDGPHCRAIPPPEFPSLGAPHLEEGKDGP